MNNNMPVGVIFDMDGLMLESEGLWTKVDMQVVASYGLEFRPELKPLFMGCERLESAKRFCRAYGLSDAPEEVAEKRARLSYKFYKTDVELMPGINELVDRLLDWGKPLAVATSAEAEIVRIVREQFDIFNRFNHIVCADEIENGKPAPDLYLEGARRLGIPAGECMALEDSPNGIKAARAAGMKVIGVPNPDVDVKEMTAASALVAKLDEITIDFIKQLYK